MNPPREISSTDDAVARAWIVRRALAHAPAPLPRAIHPHAEARMNKLRLDLDSLDVESFATLAPADDRGTVFGQEMVLTPKCVVTSGINSCWCTEQSCP